MRTLDFVNVVRCLGVSDGGPDDTKLYVLLEYMPGGDLKSRLEKDGRNMRLAERLWYCHQIAQGMAYLTMRGKLGSEPSMAVSVPSTVACTVGGNT